MASFNFTAPGGGDPLTYTLQLARVGRPTAGDVVYAAGRQKTRILQRSQRGVDVNGSPFVAYSPKYAKFREKKGRNATPVDLTFTGLMNKSMTVTVGGLQSISGGDAPVNDFALGFYGDEAVRARAHNEGATIRTRKGSGRGIKNTESSQRRSENSKETFTMPKRHFFDANEQDLQQMQADIGAHIQARLANL